MKQTLAAGAPPSGTSGPRPPASAGPEAPARRAGRFHYIDVLAALAALMVLPVYLYGFYVLALAGVALAAALVVEYICDRLAGRPGIPRRDYSWAVTALVVTMLLPAGAPLWAPAFAVVFGLCIAKHPFGGTGRNIFNPAAAGVAFCGICWPELLFRYPVPFTTQGGAESAAYGASPASVLRIGGTPKIDYFDVFLGRFAGPLGVTCMIVLAAALLYLLCRRRASLAIVLPAFLVVLAAAVLFPRVGTGRTNSIIFEFASGAFVFGVIFLANDPATRPDRTGGRMFYGFLIGALTLVMRRFGAIELEFVYVILLANIFAAHCDRWAELIVGAWRKFTGKTLRHARTKKRRAGAEGKRSLTA